MNTVGCGLVVLGLLGGAACGGGDEASEIPPTELRELSQWIEDASYLSWTCEPALRPAEGSSPHGDARVCQNSLLVEAVAGSGAFPVGAASVKEQAAADGTVAVVSVAVRGREAAGGEAWYWMRRNQGLEAVLVDGYAVPECTDCHVDAPRDHVFTRLE